MLIAGAYGARGATIGIERKDGCAGRGRFDRNTIYWWFRCWFTARSRESNERETARFRRAARTYTSLPHRPFHAPTCVLARIHGRPAGALDGCRGD